MKHIVRKGAEITLVLDSDYSFEVYGCDESTVELQAIETIRNNGTCLRHNVDDYVEIRMEVDHD